MDFDIFLQEEFNDECSSVSECKAIRRLVTALLYYGTLSKRECDEAYGLSIFSEFLLETYPNYLNDNIHLTTSHEADLEIIYLLLLENAYFIKCNVDKCLLSDRHCNIMDGKNGIIDGKKLDLLPSFHRHTFDTLHFYLMHLFELGLRQKKEEQQEDEKKEDENEDEWKCVDVMLKKQRFIIDSKRKNFARFATRFEPQTNKFNIQITINNQSNNNKKTETTFLDSIYEHIKDTKHVSVDNVNNFQHYLCDEAFDSDAIMQDLDNVNSNILQAIICPPLSKAIYKYIQQHKLQRTVFSTGFSFFYWPHFSAKDHKIRVQPQFNRNDYGGYSQFDLFIKKPKYLDLKQEVLSNKDNEVGIDEYNSVIVKTNQFMQTQRVKKTKCTFNRYDDIQNFGIKKGEAMTKLHVHSLLFYTDFSELSTFFSKTFRKLKVSETLKEIKERNRNYWWLSKLLIESVNCFGSDGDFDEEHGPFFCGMNVVLTVPSFMIRLRGPTSTTNEIMTATNFAKDNGIILELNNINGLCKYLKFFNVSWLSRFKEESERLFISGQWQIEIISIRVTATWDHYGSFFHSLSVFDAALNGGGVDAVKGFNLSDAKVIKLLFSENQSLPKYIKDTWNMFTFHKKTLIINLDYVVSYPLYLQDLILESVDKSGGASDEDITDNRNLVNGKLMNVFPNLTHIEIYCTCQWGSKSYQFGLCVLLDILSLLETRNKIKCSLHGVWKDVYMGDRRSWLFYVYSSISSLLICKYKEITTSIKETRASYDCRQDLLIFECE